MLTLIDSSNRQHILESGAELDRTLLYSVDGQRINVKSRSMPPLHIGFTPLARDFNLWYWLDVKKGRFCVLGPFKGFNMQGQYFSYRVRSYVQGVIYPFWAGSEWVWCVAVICHTDYGYETEPILIDNQPIPEG